MPIEDHLKRHNLADLFLDTYPCNAHTTASDTLRSGLPMITLMGETFASRVSASLLSSLDLKELITENFNDYSSLAIKFGNNPELLKKIKIKLNENIKNKTLFDSKLFTKNLEFAYDKVYKNFLANKKPDHIFL
jgi:predicted O-linked N-acetylglucosamine transferase (SPINDLY family)